ncbi:hypothetical protein PFHG_01819 [Plasmodium falciparum HB3]|uniref:Uncharacterized protein n=1 Tax=Plasmodium falciparum (isolate HB3) TaxID=137071 RepID=A0A0L7K9T6_PLAFX|nr:hypothetical protein PFHG_01819 [Plasmodium falciparum HB3]
MEKNKNNNNNNNNKNNNNNSNNNKNNNSNNNNHIHSKNIFSYPTTEEKYKNINIYLYNKNINTYLYNKNINTYLYNKNIYYKINNFTHKINILCYHTQMKYNYMEFLGMNIIKKKISVDDFIYMHKEIHKILNEYIYIFNKDLFLFNYKFLYTLSYNIHYIYKNYIENKNNITNDFYHIHNILNNLSYIIYIIVYSIYININKGCLCNSICNIYLNNFFFLLLQNLFYLLLLFNNNNNNNNNYNYNNIIKSDEHNYFNFISSNQDENQNDISKFFKTKEKQNIILLNNINNFYFNKLKKKVKGKDYHDANMIIYANDIYQYLFVTKNSCIYFFKFIIFYILEILKNSYFKIHRST